MPIFILNTGTSSPATTFQTSRAWISLQRVFKRKISVPPTNIETHLLLFPIPSYHSFLKNGIRAQGAQHIANALRTNTTLTTLHLDENEIGAQGAQRIADALRTNTTLTNLNLSGNRIGAGGTQHIADALRTNTVILISFD
ncbi:unnamed protein product [Adineta ricciae]|uniref:RNI-like protein n=1 Tax=Adineta ricciae TaxID=249248 RepID=A0A816G1N7_ADIRI|nr:unnamed protein product [Adineta ricciae]